MKQLAACSDQSVKRHRTSSIEFEQIKTEAVSEKDERARR
jgi:hypothetical protein